MVIDGNTEASTSGCVASNGHTYRLVVTAVDRVGLATTIRSDGVLVDATPPVVDVPVVQHLGPSGIHAHTQWVAFTLAAADPESQVGYLTYSIHRFGESGRVVDASSYLQPAGSFNGTVNVTLSEGDELQLGGRYRVTVAAVNHLGVETAVTSAPFLVDTTPPDAGSAEVFTLSLPASAPRQGRYPAVVYGADVSVDIRGWKDDQSGLAEEGGLEAALFVVTSEALVSAIPRTRSELLSVPQVTDPSTSICATGSSSGIALLKPLTPLPPYGTYSAPFSDVPVCNGTWLVPVLIATNPLGLSTAGTGAPYRVVISNLTAGVVRDGWTPGSDINTLSVGNGVWATFTPFQDSHGGDISYEASFGTSRGEADLVPWFRLKGEQPDHASVVDRFTIRDGATVHASIRGTNDQGAAVIASSDGGAFLD